MPVLLSNVQSANALACTIACVALCIALVRNLPGWPAHASEHSDLAHWMFNVTCSVSMPTALLCVPSALCAAMTALSKLGKCPL